VPRLRIAASLLLCAFAVSALAAEERPPLTKEQERANFHPRRLGIEVAARRAGFERRLEMENASLLSVEKTKLNVQAERETGFDGEDVPGEQD